MIAFLSCLRRLEGRRLPCSFLLSSAGDCGELYLDPGQCNDNFTELKGAKASIWNPVANARLGLNVLHDFKCDVINKYFYLLSIMPLNYRRTNS
jgi:hypothetical protein